MTVLESTIASAAPPARERVTTWEPEPVLGFELFECTRPVKRLHHDYLTAVDGGTRLLLSGLEQLVERGADTVGS